MALNEAFVGKAFPYPETYFVGVEKIREFARAIGDENPLYIDRDAVRTAAGNDLISLRTEVTDPSGAPVCTAYGTLVARGTA